MPRRQSARDDPDWDLKGQASDRPRKGLADQPPATPRPCLPPRPPKSLSSPPSAYACLFGLRRQQGANASRRGRPLVASKSTSCTLNQGGRVTSHRRATEIDPRRGQRAFRLLRKRGLQRVQVSTSGRATHHHNATSNRRCGANRCVSGGSSKRRRLRKRTHADRALPLPFKGKTRSKNTQRRDDGVSHDDATSRGGDPRTFAQTAPSRERTPRRSLQPSARVNSGIVVQSTLLRLDRPWPFSRHSQASQPPDRRVDPPSPSHVCFQFLPRSDPLVLGIAASKIDRKILSSLRRVLSLGDDAARPAPRQQRREGPNKIWDFLTWSKSA